jgi:hypothetical protein
MAIEWLAGNRLRGTTAERPALALPSGSVGGWVEVGRTTLGSAGDTIDVTSLPDKRYYMVLHNSISTGNVTSSVRLNGDSSNNYAWRYNDNGGSDGTITSNNAMNAGDRNPPTGGDAWAVSYLANKSGKEKLMYSYGLQRNSAGAGSAPGRGETSSKWTGTDVIDQITSVNQESGDWASGSEMVVLGFDPADTHTTNFWEELSSVTTTESGTISSGTITAKKYLMYNIIGKKASGTGTESARFRFNGDTGSNYAQRNSINGTDYTYGNQSSANIGGDGNTAGEMAMYTGFIINNASTEKLWVGHSAFGNTAGNNIGNKGEIACKWANTSDQITSIECMGTTFDAGAIMKVWGSD